MGNTPIVCDENSLLDNGVETDINWVWSDADKKRWEVETSEYQEFYRCWRNSSADFCNEFPYKLSLGADSDGRPLLPLYSYSTPGNRILVTKSYDDMFHRLLYLRWNDMGRTTGAVITGQPGIGKTTFLNFMLAWLIQAGQVVLLCDASRIHLFFNGQTYSRSADSGFITNLPIHLKMPYYPIWALIDVGHGNTESPISTTRSIWPVQTSPLNPTRWKSWRRQNGAALLGMPIWDMKELMKGLCLLPEYDDFRSRLEKSLPLLEKSTHPNAGDMAIDAVLEVLQTERERKGVMVVEKTDNRDEMDGGASTAVMDQGENIVEEADQPQAPVDNALKILVHNTTEELGFAPRDVSNGVLELPNTRKQHVTAVEKLDCSGLKAIVETLYGSRKPDDFSARVVVVHPLQISASHDWWESTSNPFGSQGK